MFCRWLRSRRINKMSFADGFDEARGAPPSWRIKNATDDELHKWIASDQIASDVKSKAQSELRRRESWRTPAKWALVVSCISLLFSALAIAIGFPKTRELMGLSTSVATDTAAPAHTHYRDRPLATPGNRSDREPPASPSDAVAQSAGSARR